MKISRILGVLNLVVAAAFVIAFMQPRVPEDTPVREVAAKQKEVDDQKMLILKIGIPVIIGLSFVRIFVASRERSTAKGTVTG